MSKSITNEWECAHECVFVRTCVFIVKKENIILDTGVGVKGVCALILSVRVCVSARVALINIKHLAAHTHPSPSCGCVETISSEQEPS